VVPISEQEHAHAIGSRIDLSHLANSREALDSNRAPSPVPAVERTLTKVGHAMGEESPAETIEMLAASEMWGDANSAS
jgi:hypothetical protein